MIVVDGLAASGGYITAIAGDHIVAKQTSIVGSIGVLFQYPNVGDLCKIGVKVESIKSSPLKAARTASSRQSPEARAAIESIVKDSYAWFKAWCRTAVTSTTRNCRRRRRARLHRSSGRRAQARRRARRRTSRHLLARQGKEYRREAAGPRLPAARPFRDLPFLHAMAVATLDAAGLGALARHVDDWGTIQAVERLNLDGLLALWHPTGANRAGRWACRSVHRPGTVQR